MAVLYFRCIFVLYFSCIFDRRQGQGVWQQRVYQRAWSSRCHSGDTATAKP